VETIHDERTVRLENSLRDRGRWCEAVLGPGPTAEAFAQAADALGECRRAMESARALIAGFTPMGSSESGIELSPELEEVSRRCDEVRGEIRAAMARLTQVTQSTDRGRGRRKASEMGRLTIELREKATGKGSALWLVHEDGKIVGMLEKYRDTRTETHPWKAFSGYGLTALYLGAFYQKDGGKKSAIEAIVNARG
jgi:hypothetical protein